MKRLALFLLAIAGVWMAGFVWFVCDARKPAEQIAPFCDGIVALTGGEARIETSLALFHDGHGRLLLISGVDPRFTLRHFWPPGSLPVSTDLAARITLGRRAISTIGNAHETAEWAHAHALNSLIVVTAGYHMRRALLEIHRMAPDLKLMPYPVLPPALNARFSKQTLRLLIREYSKLLGAGLGYLTGLPDGNDGLNQR